MQAGFAKRPITPPVGTRMEGFGDLQLDPTGAVGVHDDLFVRALYCRDGEEQVLVLAYDVIFFSRETSDRLKAAVGRVLDLSPRQILINASHTHCSPHASNYAIYASMAPDRFWLNVLERKTIEAACESHAKACPVTLHAGSGHCRLPVSRRRPVEGRGICWLPWPEGRVCDALPVCVFRNEAEEAICLLFSVSCHPSTVHINEFSAEYPGRACTRLDAQLGAELSLFLQGAGGDTKPCVIADGPGEPYPTWRSGTWKDIEAAGDLVAEDVLGILDNLQPVQPAVQSALAEMDLPLQELPGREQMERYLQQARGAIRKHWAERQIEKLGRGFGLESSAMILAQGICLGKGLRLVALEGEPVAELGLQICNHFRSGITFPLGYSNGTGLYLPTSRMLEQGGYEVNSYYEYGYAATLARGIEAVLDRALAQFGQAGIG